MASDFPGTVHPDVDQPALRAWLLRQPDLRQAEALSGGSTPVYRVADPLGTLFPLTLKLFPPESDARQRLLPSRAARAYAAAERLHARGVPTPRPVAWLTHPRGTLLVTEYLPNTLSLREALRHHYFEAPRCADIMQLLQRAADTIRAMHGAGVEHRDLGNQNLLLQRQPDGTWGPAFVIDLNRCRLSDPLPPSRRGRDNGRIDLPSDLLRVFLEMQWAPVPPPREFHSAQQQARRQYQWHSRTRRLRHPFRERNASPRADLHERDLWIWDDRSMQAIPALRSRDKRKYYRPADGAAILRASLRHRRGRDAAFQDLMRSAWSAPVPLKGKIGLSLNLSPERFENERRWLQPLGRMPLLVRLYHHEPESKRRYAVEAIRKLHTEGHRLVVALVQDRRAIRFPDKWAEFVNTAAGALSGFVEAFEVGHAINRVKWGIWNYREYRQFLAPFADWRHRYPQIALWGPAGIDFELPRVAPLLDQLPSGTTFDALSHHLYVDRRGAPENEQQGLNTLGKLAKLRALARTHPGVAERLIISEVNWPLLHTGVWSPVGSPYESPGPRFNDPSVTEDQYAAYMIRYLLLALGSGLAERVYWWNLAAHGFGLIDDRDPQGWRPRPAYHAFQDWLTWSRDAEIISRLPSPDPREYLLLARHQGKDLHLHWHADTDALPQRIAP